MSVSINADMGEALGLHTFGHDEGLLPLVDTVNVACGFHAGDPSTMRATVTAAVAAGVSIGAHPGLPDLVGFGRREMAVSPDQLRDLVAYQVGALSAFLHAEGAALHHIKPHGAMYGMVARDEELMGAVCDVAADAGVGVFGMPGTAHESVARERGVAFTAEFYVDLAYRGDGSLAIVARPGATDPALAAARALAALSLGTTTAITGEELAVRVESICVHSDTPNAPQVAAAVRAVMDEMTPDHH